MNTGHCYIALSHHPHHGPAAVRGDDDLGGEDEDLVRESEYQLVRDWLQQPRPPDCWRGYKVRCLLERWTEPASQPSELEDVTESPPGCPASESLVFSLLRSSDLRVYFIPRHPHTLPLSVSVSSRHPNYHHQPQSSPENPFNVVDVLLRYRRGYSLFDVACSMSLFRLFPLKLYVDIICTNSQVTQYTTL